MHSEIEIPKINKENSFNLVRLICCIGIIVAHTVVIANLDVFYIDIRYEAVKAFFIISGFWVFQSYVRSKSLKEYFTKRLKKIVPTYYLVLALTILIFSFTSSLGMLGYFSSPQLLKYVLSNVFFLNFLCDSLPGVLDGAPINNALWTLKIEIGFYLILPLIIYILCRLGKGNKRKNNAIIFALIVLCDIVNTLISLMVDRFHLPSSLSEQLPMYLPYFLVGILYCTNFSWWRDKSLLLTLVAFIVIIVRYFIVLPVLEIIMPFAISEVVFSIAVKFHPLHRISSLLKKDITYPMYLIHCPIINLLIYFNTPRNLGILYPIIIILISALLGFALDIVVSHRVLRKKYS